MKHEDVKRKMLLGIWHYWCKGGWYSIADMARKSEANNQQLNARIACIMKRTGDILTIKEAVLRPIRNYKRNDDFGDQYFDDTMKLMKVGSLAHTVR